MAANRPTRRKLIGTPKGKFGYVCEEFNILTAGHDLRQWACPFSDFRPGFIRDCPLLGCRDDCASWTRVSVCGNAHEDSGAWLSVQRTGRSLTPRLCRKPLNARVATLRRQPLLA